MTTRRTFLRLLGIGAPAAATIGTWPFASTDEPLRPLSDFIHHVEASETPFMALARANKGPAPDWINEPLNPPDYQDEWGHRRFQASWDKLAS